MPKIFTGVHPSESQSSSQNNSVPRGHRTKCRRCGAVDNTVLQGQRRLVRCGACGSTVARRRAPKVPRIISYVVICRHDQSELKPFKCSDRFAAERYAISFCERGPVARDRVAAIIELLDDQRTGNVQVLTYSNYRGRRGHMEWTGGCESCKGRGTVSVRVPGRNGEKSTIKFVACVACDGLGGELNRSITYKRLVA